MKRLFLLIFILSISLSFSQKLESFFYENLYSYNDSINTLGKHLADSVVKRNSENAFAYFMRAYFTQRTPIKITEPESVWGGGDDLGNDALNYSFYLFDTSAIISDLNKAIELDSKLAKAYIARASYYRFRDAQKSISDLGIAISLNPDSLEPYYSRAIILEQEGIYKKALLDYEKCFALGMYAAEYYNHIADVHRKMGALKHAIKYYSKSITSNPSGLAFKYRGITHFELNEYKKALSDLKNAIGVIDNEDTYLLIGKCLYELGDIDEACRTWQELSNRSFLGIHTRNQLNNDLKKCN